MKRECRTLTHLKLKIQDTYNSEWPRFMDRYNDLCEIMERRPSKNLDIDSVLARKCKKDIENDGSKFLNTQDGLASRINSWLDEILLDMA